MTELKSRWPLLPVRISPEQLAALDDMAWATRRTRSDALRDILSEVLDAWVQERSAAVDSE